MKPVGEGYLPVKLEQLMFHFFLCRRAEGFFQFAPYPSPRNLRNCKNYAYRKTEKPSDLTMLERDKR